jgi:outer membrane protein assembly factor BamB
LTIARPRTVYPLNPSGDLVSCDIVRLRNRDDILLTQKNNSTGERKITLVNAITHETIRELPQDITKAIPGTGDWLRQDYPFKAMPGTGVWLRQDPINALDYPFNNRTLESGTLVQPSPSLQAKGLGDLLWANPGGGLGPAISGKDFSVLWHVLGPDRVPVVPRFRSILGAAAGPVSVGNYRAAELHGSLACRPILVDVDGDGLPDVVALFAAVLENGQLKFVNSHEMSTNRVVWAFLLAVKGNTGEQLWRYDFPTKDLRNPNDKGSPVSITEGDWFAAYLTRIDNRQAILVRAEQQIVAIDVCTGVPVGPFGSVGRLMDGKWYPTTDGRGLLIVRYDAPGFSGNGQVASHRFTGDLSKHLWRPVSHEKWGENKGMTNEWRILRNPQLITPTDILCAEYYPHTERSFNESFEISCFDIEQGKVLWTERLTRWSMLYGTSLDSTTLNTALLPTHRDDPRGCYLTAYFISGKMYGHAPNNIYLLTAANMRSSGQLLGRRLQPLPGKPPPQVTRKIRWLPVSANQPPYLAVNYDHGSHASGVRPNNTLSTYLLGADGRLRHVWSDVYAIGAADFAGDGMPYLYGVHRTGTGSIALDIAPLGPREIWRRPGCWSSYEADEANEGEYFWEFAGYRAEYLCPPSLGGDVLLIDFDKGTVRRISGEDGTVLWQSKGVTMPLGGSQSEPRNVICRCVRLDQKEYLAIKTGSYRGSSTLLNAQSGELIPEPHPSLPDAEPANTGLRPHVSRDSRWVDHKKEFKDYIEWKDQKNRVVWKCAGPGRISGILPPIGTGKPPSALFVMEMNGKPYTVCLEALPAGDTPPVLDFGPNATEPLRVTLPWVVPGKQGLTRAAWSGLISMGIVLFFAFRRKIAALGMFAWFLCFPVVVGAFLLNVSLAGGRIGEYSELGLLVESAVFVLGLIAWRWSAARCEKKNLGLRVMSLLGVPVFLSVLLLLIALMCRPLDDPFDWSGWYLLWPYAYSSFGGHWPYPFSNFDDGSLFANPMSWVAIWVAGRVTRRVLGQGEDPRMKMQKL